MWIHADISKWMPVAVKYQFKKEGGLEEDEFPEMTERLENIYEAYEMFNENWKEEEWCGSDY